MFSGAFCSLHPYLIYFLICTGLSIFQFQLHKRDLHGKSRVATKNKSISDVVFVELIRLETKRKRKENDTPVVLENRERNETNSI